MAISCNLELKQIADASALKQSCVPVFLCDGDLKVCTKSAGAKRLISRPAEKSSIRRYLSNDVLERIENSGGHAFNISFKNEQYSANAVVTSGEICGQRYYCVVVKPGILFCPYPEPWYMEDACVGLADTVQAMLSSPVEDDGELNRYCALISRLCAFSESRLYSGGFPNLSGATIADIMSTLSAQCPLALSLVGASVDMRVDTGLALAADISPRGVYTMMATIMVSLVTLAKHGRIEISCGRHGEGAVKMTMGVASDLSKRGDIHGFDSFCNAVTPLRLELAALRDMANANGILLDAEAVDGRLTVTMTLAVHDAKNVVFRADDADADALYLAQLLTELCTIIAA